MTELCTLDAQDLRDALHARAGVIDIHYGPALDVYGLVVTDRLLFVTPITRRAADGTLDTAAALTALDGYTLPTVTVAYDGGVFTLATADSTVKADTPAPAIHAGVQSVPTPRPPLPSAPLPCLQPLALPSPAVAVVSGLLTLAALYTHGGAQIKPNPARRQWDIRTSAATAYRVACTPTATEVTLYLQRRGAWAAVETNHLPPLSALEQARLFLIPNTRGEFHG